MTLYDDLGLSADATDAEIKAAHRAHVRKTHPDNGGSTGDFARGQKAYEVLGDSRRRQRYDETGEDDAHDPEAAERAEILKVVSQAIMQYVAGDADLEFIDIAALASQSARDSIGENEKQKAMLEASVDRIRTAAQRFKLKSPHDNDLIADMFRGRESELLRQLERCEHGLQIKAKALTVLEAYSYTTSPRPPVGGLDYHALSALMKRGSTNPP